jgi:hypothetical protein
MSFDEALEFGALTLMNVNFRSILSLPSEKPAKVDIQLDGVFWTIKSLSSNSKSRKDNGPGSLSTTYLAPLRLLIYPFPEWPPARRWLPLSRNSNHRHAIGHQGS